MKRNISDILNFRVDISPFLVHLTRDDNNGNTAKDKLISILDNMKLIRGSSTISAMRFADGCNFNDPEVIRDYLSAICFTETPILEIHTMLDIADRQVDLQPYGLIFIRDKLRDKGVNPVLYLNTYFEDREINKMIDLLWKSKDFDDDYKEYTKKLFPLISCFGLRLRREEEDIRPVDFYWEREWRYCLSSELAITNDDIFMGLCKDQDIAELEEKYIEMNIEFIDPRKSVKWYAKKLVDTRRTKEIMQSVV